MVVVDYPAEVKRQLSWNELELEKRKLIWRLILKSAVRSLQCKDRIVWGIDLQGGVWLPLEGAQGPFLYFRISKSTPSILLQL